MQAQISHDAMSHLDTFPAMDWSERLNEARKNAGMSVTDLATAAGIGRESVQKYCDGKVANPRGIRLRQLCHVLGISEQYLRYGANAAKVVELPNARLAPPLSPPASRPDMPKDVPVMGQATGGPDGAMTIGDATEYIRRPTGLSGVQGIYAVFVVGESMEPRFRTGELVFVSPTRPVRVGDDVVVQCRDDQNEIVAFIKVVMGRSGNGWTFSQYNPQGIWSPPWPVVAVHRIFTTADLHL